MAEAERQRRVVVAHIEETVRQILRAALESRGYEVWATSRGEEAIRLAAEEDPGLLLVSLELENVDGWRVAEVLAGRSAGVAVVALTADARVATRRRAKAAGFTAYMTLPIAPFDLIDRLEALRVHPGPG